jgi:ATP-dependent protease ClpP protease subunit
MVIFTMVKLSRKFLSVIFMTLFPLSASAVEFSLINGSSKCSGCLIIKAAGEITELTPDKFDKFLTSALLDKKKNTTLVIDSPGGSLWGGIELGRKIRSLGFDTHVGKIDSAQGDELNIIAGQCASACAYAFLGGKNRSKEVDSRYGLHQISTTTTSAVPLNQAIKSTQNLLSTISSYVEKMGVSSEIVNIATQTESERINWIDSKTMMEHGVINSVGLSQQKPWKMVQPKTWSVFSLLENGSEDLILITCREIPTRTNKRGHVKVSITPSLTLPSDSPYVNGYSAAEVSVTLGKSNISRTEITVFFSGVEQTIHGIEIPFWVLNDALQNNTELSVSISYPDNLPQEFLLQNHPLPTIGLNNVITELRRGCHHLGG